MGKNLESDDLRLAVSTPRSVKLDEDVLGIIKNNILIVVCNNHCDWAFLFLGDWLGFDAGLQLAINKALDKCSNVLFSQRISLEGVLLVLGNLLDGERREFVGWEVQVGCMCAECLCVNDCNVDDAFMLLGNGLEGLGERGTFFRSLSEDEGERDSSL